MNEEAKKWMEQAEEDYDDAQYLFNGKRYKKAAFFCQQAVEKALKSVILQKEKEIPKIHDLAILATRVDLPEELRQECKELTIAYIHARYPDTPEVRDLKNKCKRYLNFAEKVLKWIQEQIL